MNILFKPQFVRYIKYSSMVLIMIFALDLLISLTHHMIQSDSSPIQPLYLFSIGLLSLSLFLSALMMLKRGLYGASIAIITSLLYILLTFSNDSLNVLDFHAEYVLFIGSISFLCFMYDRQLRNKAVELSIMEHKLSHLEQNYQITKSMMEITPEMLLDDDLDKLLDRILKKAIELIPRAQSGSILIKQGGMMKFRAAVGYDLNSLKKIQLRFEDMFQYRIGNLYEPAVIQDIKTFNEKNLNQEVSASGVLEVSVAKAVLTSAILLNKEIYGFINLDNLEDQNAFQNQDKLLIKHLAQQIEVALKNHALIEEIHKMSQYDTLTGAHSRQYHEKMIHQIFEQAQIEHTKFCIAVIDVNDLKKVNDTLGHSVGDAYLIHFSDIFKKFLKEDSIFSRTGGDEFVMVFSNCEPNCAKDTILAIREEFKRMPFQTPSHSIEVDFGCGIACYPNDGSDVASLMRLSDLRMYENKRKQKQDRS